MSKLVETIAYELEAFYGDAARLPVPLSPFEQKFWECGPIVNNAWADGTPLDTDELDIFNGEPFGLWRMRNSIRRFADAWGTMGWEE